MPSLPVKFNDFIKDPVKAILYMAIIAIVALFGFLYKGWASERKDLKDQLVKCDTKNYTQDVEIKQIRTQYVETFGLLKEVQSKIKTLQELGQIK